MKYLPDLTADSLNDVQFIGIDHHHLGFSTDKRGDANVRQGGAEFDVVWAEFPGSAAFINRIERFSRVNLSLLKESRRLRVLCPCSADGSFGGIHCQ